ncbi:MAG: Tol-Pal system protein TolQ [Pseudomonadota bacterium]|nr:Tol-Pal system protein TolQ [Pseudomonadota bacterium]
MSAPTSIIGYFLQAGWVVKSVMMILLVASIISWGLIIQRTLFFKQKMADYQSFNRRFWGSTDLSRLFSDVDNNIETRFGIAAIFHAGFKELMRLRQQSTRSLDSLQRVMQISYAKEAEALEQHLGVFASIGSLAPYIGLFGTVWGIMTSFQALGHAQQATIAMVAPGIAEALVATAMGLFTAIPAVIAYNRFSQSCETLLNRYALFQEELLALISEQVTH